ncbi:MAG: transcriptional regulator [Myxococcota bacterium]
MFVFADFEFDPEVFELRSEGNPVRIEPRVFDLLHYLIRHRERVVPKEELLERVWNGASVSESALISAIRDARRAVGDSGARQRVIRTVPRRGFRFVAETTETPGAFPPVLSAVAAAEELDTDDPSADASNLRRTYQSCRANAEQALEAGDRRAAKQAWLEAAVLARWLGSPEALAKSAIGMARIPRRGFQGDELLMRLLREASEALPEARLGLRSELVSLLAEELCRHVDFDEGRSASGELLGIARTLGTPDAVGSALTARLVWLSSPDDAEERTRCRVELEATAEASGCPQFALWACYWEVGERLEAGDLRAARHAIDRHGLVARTSSDARDRARHEALETSLDLAEGRLERARDRNRKAQVLAAESTPDPLRVHVALQEQWLDVLDRSSRVERVDALALLPLPDAYRPPLEAFVARLHAEAGRLTRARDELHRQYAEGGVSRAFAGRCPLFTLAALADVAAWTDARELAAELHEALQPYAGRFCVGGNGHTLGSVAQRLASLESLLGRHASAARRFAAARVTEADGAGALADAALQQAFASAAERARAARSHPAIADRGPSESPRHFGGSRARSR